MGNKPLTKIAHQQSEVHSAKMKVRGQELEYLQLDCLTLKRAVFIKTGPLYSEIRFFNKIKGSKNFGKKSNFLLK